MKNIYRFFVLLVITSVSVLGFYQTLRYVFLTPEGYYYPLVHNYEQDFYWYLSLMRQGWDGNLAVTTKYTAEQFTPVFVNTFFPIAGMIARALAMPIPVMYTFLRFAGAFGLLFFTYILSGRLNGSRKFRLLAMVAVVFGTPFLYRQNGQQVMYGEFWTGFDPVMRIAWLPHHNLSNAMFIYLLFLDLRFMNYELRITSKIKLLLYATFSFLATWLNPATGILILFVFSGLAITNRKKASLITNLGVLAGAGLSLVILYFIQNTTFPWTAFRDWEKYNQYPVDLLTYLKILGLPGILAWGGVAMVFFSRNRNFFAIVLWYLFPLVGLLFLSRIIGVSNSRFLQGAGYIPAALLSAYFIGRLVGKLPVKFHPVSYLISGLIIVGSGMPSLVRSFSIQEYYIRKNLNNTLVMVPAAVTGTIKYLDTTPEAGLVIAPESVSLLVPALSKHRVYAGHPTFTYNPDGGNKSAKLSAFLYGTGDEIRMNLMSTASPVAIVTDTEIPGETLKKTGYRIAYRNGNLAVWVK